MKIKILHEYGHDYRGRPTAFKLRVDLLDAERMLDLHEMRYAIVFEARKNAAMRLTIYGCSPAWVAAPVPLEDELWPESFTVSIW